MPVPAGNIRLTSHCEGCPVSRETRAHPGLKTFRPSNLASRYPTFDFLRCLTAKAVPRIASFRSFGCLDLNWPNPAADVRRSGDFRMTEWTFPLIAGPSVHPAIAGMSVPVIHTRGPGLARPKTTV